MPSLLSLPGEIWNNIYDCVVELVGPTAVVDELAFSTLDKENPLDLQYTRIPHPLNQVCSQIRKEFQSLLDTCTLPTCDISTTVVDFDFGPLLRFMEEHPSETTRRIEIKLKLSKTTLTRNFDDVFLVERLERWLGSCESPTFSGFWIRGSHYRFVYASLTKWDLESVIASGFSSERMYSIVESVIGSDLDNSTHFDRYLHVSVKQEYHIVNRFRMPLRRGPSEKIGVREIISLDDDGDRPPVKKRRIDSKRARDATESDKDFWAVLNGIGILELA